jgi:putative ABC transport system permease protein
MIRHLFKMVWNRKLTNVLIVAEILCSFVVVFTLVAMGMYTYGEFRDPLGFDYEDVWTIDVNRNSVTEYGAWSPEEAATFRRLLETLKSMDGVVVAAGASTAPYKGSVHIRGWDHDDRRIDTELSIVTAEFADVLGLELVSGRWLQEEDSALEWTPVVVDEDMARELVGDEDPIGERVSDSPEVDYKVVGVVREYQPGGEFNEDRPYTFRLAGLDGEDVSPLSTFVVKLAPGTRADFEEPMVEALQSIAQGWSFNVKHLEAAREAHLKEHFIPLAGMGVVAAFLLLMVVLGLTGVMWQNVTRRTREIGLRRATGAHRARIHRQIVGEVMVTASLGLTVGSLLAVQVPLISPIPISYGIVVPALLVSAALILLLAALCGLYPGWSATRIQPAEALHYE